jgi:hypothetical protein
VSFINHNHLELTSLDNASQPHSKVVRYNEDAALGVKVVLGRHKYLNVICLQKSKPVEELVSPVVPQGGRTNHNYGPVFSVQVGNANGLDSLSHAHFVANQAPAVVRDAKLHACPLEVVQTIVKGFWQLKQVGPNVFVVIEWHNLLLGVVTERHSVLGQLKNELGDRVHVNASALTEALDFVQSLPVFEDVGSPLTPFVVPQALVLLQDVHNLVGATEISAD